MGGEHKCPLCSATFTRPQHVGRHLRAHTGDRPYECKECPLRFARSDLLSRHVNKAHPKPDGSGGDRKGDKRGRRKSMSSQNPSGITASRPPVVHPANVPPAPIARPPQPHPEHAAFQAQRMYPNHPLLQQNTGLWAQQFSLGHAHQYVPDLIMPSFSTGVSAVEVSPQTSFDPTLTHAAPPLSLDLAVKKRACDQCNHSKVRCDCADPCARCAHRSIRCSYTKTPRTRTHPGPLNTGVGVVANSQPLSGISPTNTTSMRSSSPHSGQVRMLAPDATLVNTNPAAAVARPLVPDPQWDSGIPQNSSGTNDNSIPHQSPAVMNMSLTPTLTDSTSSSTEASSEHLSSAHSINGWILPPVVPPIDYGGIQTDAIGLASSFHGTGTLFRSRQDSAVSALDSASPNYAATTSSEEDETSSVSWTDKDGEMARRRRSSAGQWANAIDQLHLDDSGIPFDASGNMQFPFVATSSSGEPARNATFPMDASVPANLSRAPSSQDNFWKLFLDPAALASPDVGELGQVGAEMTTPRGLSKSNSMPDLKTPPTVSAHYAPLQFMDDPNSITTAPSGSGDPTPGPAQQRANSDDTDVDRWRDHIQQRHASFSMNMSASTAARKVTTGQLNAATFASGSQRLFRPPPHPLISGSAMEQTLAPERTPSFMSTFDPTTPKGNPRTPTAQLLTWYTGLERPSNKRMASQTLVPDLYQKRQQTYPPPTAPDEPRSVTDSSTVNSPRKTSEMSRFNPSRMPLAATSTSAGSPARP